MNTYILFYGYKTVKLNTTKVLCQIKCTLSTLKRHFIFVWVWGVYSYSALGEKVIICDRTRSSRYTRKLFRKYFLFCLSLHTNWHLSPENSERAGHCYFLFSGFLHSTLVFGPNQSESMEKATEAPSTADICLSSSMFHWGCRCKIWGNF